MLGSVAAERTGFDSGGCRERGGGRVGCVFPSLPFPSIPPPPLHTAVPSETINDERLTKRMKTHRNRLPPPPPALPLSLPHHHRSAFLRLREVGRAHRRVLGEGNCRREGLCGVGGGRDGGPGRVGVVGRKGASRFRAFTSFFFRFVVRGADGTPRDLSHRRCAGKPSPSSVLIAQSYARTTAVSS